MSNNGRLQRSGSVWTASAHIITAVMGSGVLSLAWAVAQLGWIAGPAVMIMFSFITYYTSSLLATCYRSGDQNTGHRNSTYMDAVRANLGTYYMDAVRRLNLIYTYIGCLPAEVDGNDSCLVLSKFKKHGHGEIKLKKALDLIEGPTSQPIIEQSSA